MNPCLNPRRCPHAASGIFDAIPTYTPHRERLPGPHCTGAGALLSTGNLTDTCWPCDPTWEIEIDWDALLPQAIRMEIGEALDRILTEAP